MKTTVEGLALAYTDRGTGQPPLLFVHGFPLSRGAWDKQVEAFSATHRVLAPDLRGLGESEGSKGAVSMDRYAEDLAALLREWETGPVVLIAHSMGGYVALAFQARFPDLLRGLVLVGTRAGADTPDAATKRRATADKVRKEGPGSVIDDMAPKMLAADNPDQAMAKEVRALMEPSRAEGVAAALLGMADRPDRTPGLSRIGVPTLVVTGADDTIIPSSESQRLAEAIPGAELEIIPKAGHLVAYEQPEAFNRRLKTWLERLPAR
ncbi:alpha/beta fold hydrolase [Geothrix sp. 21YS21S-4]|uniref:alpha/beta fold hydrolase n=1 Tax=Geothrix sp. 21YS21S-4 TaxID=3068889 RepID=UPI0027B91B63|nr:alpha/beta hydrolase [Geothrix sp. 21YS21S-4]